MKISSYTALPHFEFWSGGADNAKLLTYDELVVLDELLEDIYPDGLNETQLNDLLWFDFELVCEWLGLDFDEVNER